MTTRRFNRYPAYKDSGVEWLGEIPAHWEVYALRRKLFHEAGSIKIGPFGSALKLEFMTQEGFKVYGQEHVIARDFGRGSKYIDQAKFAELAACQIQPRDIVVTMMGSSGRCAVVPDDIERGIMDSHLLRIRLPDTELDPRFLALLIDEADYVRDQIGAAGKGAIMHGLNSSIIKSVLLAAPPTTEQVRILAFLDRETARIDALVAKKERLIEVLQEQRTALITRAVTKGLDPTVPLKDSGVEWLGEIPAHWEVMAAGRLIEGIEQGWSPVAEDRQADPDEWAVIKLSAVSKGAFREGEHKALPLGLAPDTRYEIREGDFLMTRANTPELVADVCVVRDSRRRLMLCDLVYRLHWRSSRASTEFVAYWFLSGIGRHQIEVDARGASQSMVKVSQGLIRAWAVMLPPIAEQRAITAFLDRQTTRIDALVAKVRDAIERLKELRTALISAAVTGKIDVRGEVA